MSVNPSSYQSIHKRLVRLYGSAKKHTCPCGEPAVEWAYQFTGEPELRDADGRFPHSSNPDDYTAMCRPCHIRLDIEKNPGVRAEKPRKERVPVARQQRQCLQCGFICSPAGMGSHQRGYRHTGLAVMMDANTTAND